MGMPVFSKEMTDWLAKHWIKAGDAHHKRGGWHLPVSFDRRDSEIEALEERMELLEEVVSDLNNQFQTHSHLQE